MHVTNAAASLSSSCVQVFPTPQEAESGSVIAASLRTIIQLNIYAYNNTYYYSI